jgi:hypothetical protein
MPINHHEIIEEMEGQIRKCGGAWEEWSVGTAKDSRGPFFQRHREADLGDRLTYREAYTSPRRRSRDRPSCKQSWSRHRSYLRS